MITKKEKKKSFKVGDLVRDVYQGKGELSLVLDLEWNTLMGEWVILALHQKTGKKEECWASDYVPAGKSDD